MGYTIAQVITDVRRILDEQGLDDSGFLISSSSSGSTTEQDDTEISNLIEGYIVDARNFVLGGCDLSLLKASDFDTSEETDAIALFEPDGTASTMYRGIVVGPVGDLLRPVYARSPLFWRTVDTFVDRSSPEYSKLRDELTTGTPINPKGAVYWEDDGGYVEVFSIPLSQIANSDVVLYYVPYYILSAMAEDEDVHIDAGPLRAAFQYYLAGLVCQTFKDERADNFMQLAVKYMGAEETK